MLYSDKWITHASLDLHLKKMCSLKNNNIYENVFLWWSLFIIIWFIPYFRSIFARYQSISSCHVLYDIVLSGKVHTIYIYHIIDKKMRFVMFLIFSMLHFWKTTFSPPAVENKTDVLLSKKENLTPRERETLNIFLNIPRGWYKNKM